MSRDPTYGDVGAAPGDGRPPPGRMPKVWAGTFVRRAEPGDDRLLTAEGRRQTAYWLLMAGLGYRACGGLVSAVGLAVNSWGSTQPVVTAAVVVSLADVAAAAVLQRATRLSTRVLRRWMLLDALVVVLLNLWASTAVGCPLGMPFVVVFWNQVQGAVAMWYAVDGVAAAGVVVAAGAPLIGAMILVNGQVAPGDVGALVATHLMWLALAALATLIVRKLLDVRGTAALDEGLRTGQEFQRLVHLREVHDTVLQTLEAIALYASLTHVDERQRLETVAEAARTEALRLRGVLQRVHEGSDGDLDRRLEACAEDFRGRGLDVEFETLRAPDSAPLPHAVREALYSATVEALNNVVKHAGTRRARVRLSEGRAGVEVVVEDDGRGFDPARTPPRFGTTHSLRGRLTDVGGAVSISSSPGAGTRVSLRVGRPPVVWLSGRPRHRRDSALET